MMVLAWFVFYASDVGTWGAADALLNMCPELWDAPELEALWNH